MTGRRLLSDPRQIVEYPEAIGLDDGTQVAVWGDAAGGNGETRIAYAVRPPGGAFGPGVPRPQIAARFWSLAAAGDRAVLAWAVGDLPDGPAHVVVSTLRRAGPFAPRARRPAHPGAPCG